MADIVERLRKVTALYHVSQDAADEIERLRAENARLENIIWELSGKKEVQAALGINGSR